MGDGEPLFLLHNGFYSQETWDSVIAALAEHFFVVSYDRYGYGHSTHWGDIGGDIVEVGVTELERLVEHFGFKRINLLGHCLGGAVALLYTQRHSECVGRVVAESVGYYSDDDIQFKSDWTFQPYNIIPQELRQTLETMHGVEYAQIFWDIIRHYKGGYIMNPEYNILSQVRKIKNDVLLIMGDRDFYFSPAHPLPALAKMKHAALSVIPNAGHDVHIEQSEDFLYFVRRFLLSGIS